MKILLDSDVLFALFVATDVHHAEIAALISTLSGAELISTNLVIQETATVLSYKIGQDASLAFLKKLEWLDLTTLVVDEALGKKAWEVFKKQSKKGTSFIDCANLACIELYRFDGILSYDHAYPKNVRLT